jgi:hypothetical protein
MLTLAVLRRVLPAMADPTIEEVDAFVVGYKTLAGFLPEWDQNHGWNWSTRWGVLVNEALKGIVGKRITYRRPDVTA